jgi:hypothetical protein
MFSSGNNSCFENQTSDMGGGGIGIYGMAVLAYFSYGISVFSLKNCGITILEMLRYTVFAILDSKTAVIDKICLRYYGIEYPPRHAYQP